MATLIKNFFWYIAHQDELVEQYNGKYLVISGNKVIYSSPDEEKAYNYGLQQAGSGNFIMQRCSPGTEAYTSRIYTPWVKPTNALEEIFV